MQETQRIITKIWSQILDFLFPKPENVCKLEALSPRELLDLLSKAKDIRDVHTVVLFDYKDENVKQIIWELKYKGNRTMAKILAPLLLDVLKGITSESSQLLLIPIPISNKRRRERGYNQTELVCSEIKKLDIEHLLEYAPSLLIKLTHTDSQARIHASKRERQKNLENSMSVKEPGRLKGRCVVLFDDVTTSGATFSEAKRALKKAGVKKILFLAIAH